MCFSGPRADLITRTDHLETALESDMSPELRVLLTSSATASRSLHYVVEDLIDITRVDQSADSNAQSNLDEPFSLPQLLAEATAIHQDEAMSKGLSFHLTPSLHQAAPTEVAGDAHHLRKAVSLIAENAVKFTHRGGVRIEYGLDDDFVIVDEPEAAPESRLEWAIKM